MRSLAGSRHLRTTAVVAVVAFGPALARTEAAPALTSPPGGIGAEISTARNIVIVVHGVNNNEASYAQPGGLQQNANTILAAADRRTPGLTAVVPFSYSAPQL